MTEEKSFLQKVKDWYKSQNNSRQKYFLAIAVGIVIGGATYLYCLL